MKILIIPEFGNKNSGTFSFFNTLLRIHLNHHIETAIILEKKQLLRSPTKEKVFCEKMNKILKYSVFLIEINSLNFLIYP